MQQFHHRKITEFKKLGKFTKNGRPFGLPKFYYFAKSIMILFERATNSVIASGESGAFAILARS